MLYGNLFGGAKSRTTRFIGESRLYPPSRKNERKDGPASCPEFLASPAARKTGEAWRRPLVATCNEVSSIQSPSGAQTARNSCLPATEL